MVHQGLGHSIPCSFIVMSSQDTSRVTHEPISTGFREAIQGNTRQYKAIRSERENVGPEYYFTNTHDNLYYVFIKDV